MTDVTTISGSSLSEYRSKFAQSVGVSGSFKGFTASVSTNFSKETYTAAEYSFATYRSYTLKNKIGIKPNVTIEELKECLTEKAKEDIDNLTPETLFSQYGTHVIIDYRTGGSLDFHFAADMNQFTSTQNIEVAVEVGYQSKMFGASANTNTAVSNEINEKQSEVSMKLKTVGGNSTYGTAIAVDKDNSANYNAWAKSFNDETTWMLFNFDRLIPISEFATTDERKNELELAFNNWGEERDNIETDASTGTLTITAYGLKNFDVGDEGSTDAEWLWKIMAKDNAGNLYDIAVNTTEKTDKKCKKGKFLAFGDCEEYDKVIYSSYKSIDIENVKIGTGITFSILPFLEEDDGDDLGELNSSNNIYASENGPEYIFEQVGSEWQARVEGGTEAAEKDRIFFRELMDINDPNMPFIDSAYNENEDVKIPFGVSKEFILSLKQNDGSSNNESLWIYMSVYWH